MDDAPRRRLPDASASTFDVRSWLASLGRCPPESVKFVGQQERAGKMIVRYDCAGKTARVRMSPVSGMATPTWELVAEFGGESERVVLPGGTRFVWRPPRGTHA
jgi:hypothetical protein